jgi:hypothetical protein
MQSIEHDRCDGCESSGPHENQKYADRGNADTAKHLRPLSDVLISYLWVGASEGRNCGYPGQVILVPAPQTCQATRILQESRM